MNKDYSRWFIPMDKNLTIDQIIQDGGFYDIDGLWNSIISIEGKLYRGRVETLILDGTTLFMAPDKHRAYRVPGGSLDKGVENARQAENECKEEARIIVKNTTYSGVHYIREYENKLKPEPGKVIWDGTYTEVYVAEFDTYYHGYIDKKDLDPGMAKDGRFRELSAEVKDVLTEPHKEALKDILDQVIDTEPTLYTAKESTVLTEKDVDNFFMLTEEDINEAANVEEDKIHPYFTPEEMLYLGVMSESGNYYSDEAKIDNYTKDWFQNYRSNGKVGISSDWIATLQDRYEEFINTGSETSKQEILNLGWNPEIPPTIENIKCVSDNKEKEEIPDPVENMNEGYLFSKKDIMHNIDKFESGEYNICFVTGLMGSGKSTLAKNLGEYYHARVIQLDVLQNYSRFLYDKDLSDGDKQIMKVTDEFLKKNKDIHLYDFDELRTKSFKKFFNKFFPVMVRSLERDKNHKYIVEGVHIFLFVSPELLKDYPVVFMNASMTKSMFRRWKRDQFTPMDFVKYGSDDFKLFVEWEDKFRMFQKSFYETYLFLSEQDMDGEVIVPRIPHNYFTENYYEDTITPRVCLSSTIEGALKAIGSKRKIGTEFYVHTPMHECTIYHPTEQQVPDCKLTGEVWSKEPVRLTTIGKIRVTESTVTESFTYGKGLTGILNGYSYEWETMYDENLCSLIEFREYKEKEDFPSIVKRFFDTLKPIVDKYSKKEPDLHLTCKIMDSTDAGRREINFIICDEDQGTRIKASNVILQISKELSKDKYIKKMAYKIHCGDGDEGCIYCKLKLNVMKESFLVEMKRSELPDDVFGIPSERKYPMPDEKHVLSAIQFFNYVEPKYEKQLASKIIANMKKYGISGDRVGEKNRLKQYLPKTMVKEEYDFISISDEDKNHIRSIINILSDDMDNFDGFQFMNVADYEIAFDKNKPVGFAMVRLKPLSDDRYAGSISIAINPKYRRKGIAEHLVKVIISRLYDKSIDYLYWKVDPKNTASINLAKKCGFKYSNTKKGMKVYRYNISSVKESLSESAFYYNKISSSKDIQVFYQSMQDVFDTDADMDDKEVRKYMKSIKFNNKIIGYIGFSKYNIDGKKYLGIGNFMILPEYQHSGYGKKVIADLIDRYKDKYDEIYCYVDKDNSDAIKFYQKIATVDLDNLTKYGYYVSLYSNTVEEDGYILSESTYPKEVPDEIIQLLKRLNSYDYGYIKNGKKIKGMENFFNDYRSLTISEFEKYEIGVCWDYVHYEAYWFDKHGYKYDTFYIQVQDEDNDCPSHTYLVFYLPGSNKVYYFESAWGKYQGIEEFDNIGKLHNTIKERHISSANSKCDPKTYFRNTYDAKSSSWEHLKCGEYMVKVSKGRIQINEGVKSMVDKDHKQKGYIQLNIFRKERLSKANIDKWKSRYKFLRHIDYMNDEAYIFIDGDSLAAVVAVDKKDDYTWITAIEISENYRGYELSKQLLNFCVRTLHANALSVNKNNELAIQIYKDYGFKTSKESEADVKAGKSQMYYMYI